MEKPVSPHTEGSRSLPRNGERLSNSPRKKIHQETRTVNLDLFEQTLLTRGYADF